MPFWYWLVQRSARFLSVLFWRFTCRGLENVPKRGGVLVVSNHQSILDLPLLGCALPRELTYVARSTLRTSGIYRFMTGPFDVLDIRRGQKDKGAVAQIADKLSEGGTILLFPEGTRSLTGRLGPLREGFIRIAERAGVPIVTARLDGVFEVWPKGRILPGRGRIRLRIDPPIEVGDRQEVLECVRRRLSG